MAKLIIVLFVIANMFTVINTHQVDAAFKQGEGHSAPVDQQNGTAPNMDGSINEDSESTSESSMTPLEESSSKAVQPESKPRTEVHDNSMKIPTYLPLIFGISLSIIVLSSIVYFIRRVHLDRKGSGRLK